MRLTVDRWSPCTVRNPMHGKPTIPSDSLTHRPALSGVREDARAISPARGIAANVSGDHSQQATAQPQPHAQTQRATASQWARLEELRCAFRRADGDGDGVVRWPEFRAALGEVCGRHRVALSDQDAERVGTGRWE